MESTWPATTAAIEGVAPTVRTSTGATAVNTFAVLFWVLVSVSLAPRLAVLLMAGKPATSGVTLMVTWAVAPAASVPMEAVTRLPDWNVGPASESAETKVTAPGRLSVRTTPVAVNGPLFVTVAK